MVKSMTGFGRGEATGAGFAVTVELSTVNRKQFDATLWLPKEWLSFEARLQALLRTGIARGALKGSVNVRPLSDADAAAALEARFRTVCAAARRLGLQGEPTVSDLAALGEILRAEDVGGGEGQLLGHGHGAADDDAVEHRVAHVDLIGGHDLLHEVVLAEGGGVIVPGIVLVGGVAHFYVDFAHNSEQCLNGYLGCLPMYARIPPST